MIQFANQLQDEMEHALDQVTIRPEREALKARNSFEIVNDALHKLKDFIKVYEFTSIEEEIHFFKEIKPRFYHLLIYFGELTAIESRKPIGDNDTLVAYLRKIIDRNSEFIDHHQLLHSYYNLGYTEEDERFFLRSSIHQSLYPQYSVDLDTTFSTKSSAVLSKLMAFEKVNDLLGREIEYLKRGPDAPVSTPDTKKDAVVWTDSKSDLIELAYALHSRGSINSGRCQVQQIISILEIAFKVKTGNFYRTFQSMRLRKKNRTAYLDAVRESLIKRMDDPDLLF
ncbi:MAG: RteC domain-containing protein [Candidatus Pedobacter colombiensis]|uniref:RteC domain-containing protein n=1 Tax=Candidatus Pedobacter colombiensis TaxID=3121371 RepID=A0AAJ5WB63_9SPHI|nr:RteC domain-containing protein [Pedobacter sp.]WEK21352.1 MAG: RteC domain-containing protein [Pedobacter sp.]